ncbi:MAG: hypothetical protein OEZ39_05670 [Gammaproteobacteria bacterium]|nr:hypothetical protein [Gammaproteobacteria bacterium]MDH5651343.1 hypothetical protein [Gammaproteobacteria bacterium]
MSISTSKTLYDLLPAIYRVKDAEQGLPLRALFAVLQSEYDALEADIQGLYDNWFIETCDEWVVPYIADLLGVAQLQTGGNEGFSLRSYVANVLAYRRRKGTASVLEQMARDVSGWPTRAVEFQKSLITTQNLNHIRSQIPANADLRNANQLELLGSPFQTAKYSVEVRSIQGGRGKYNIPNIGLFVWRLQSYELNRVEPVRALKPDNTPYTNLYFIHPFCLEQQLFNLPRTETEITHLAEEQNVPGPLRRRPLYDELEARRASLLKGDDPTEIYFGAQPVFEIFLDKSSVPLQPEEIAICDLSDWHSGLNPFANGIAVQVDPYLGRLAFRGGFAPEQVDIRYAYGFSADIGGGPYNRSDSLEGMFADVSEIYWAGVSHYYDTQTGDFIPEFTTIRDAIDEWQSTERPHPPVAVIVILDSYTYEEDLTVAGKIELKSGQKLFIVSAEWLRGRTPGDKEWSPELGLNQFLTATRLRPRIKGEIHIKGATGSEFYMNGILLEGGFKIMSGDLEKFEVSHCTILDLSRCKNPPPQFQPLPSIKLDNSKNTRLKVKIERTICGAIELPDTINSLTIMDSIIDGVGGTNSAKYAISDAGNDGPPTTIQRSTVFGMVKVKELTLASECIFTQMVTVQRLQAGCVRFSYVPPGSVVPKRFRCQPDLAINDRRKELEESGEIKSLTPEELQIELDRIKLWMTPEFSSEDYGDPDYAQLSMGCPICPRGIRIGAEDGSEMGVFSHLKQPQREANIRANLDEYLRFGMSAEIFYVNYKEIATGLGS